MDPGSSWTVCLGIVLGPAPEARLAECSAHPRQRLGSRSGAGVSASAELSELDPWRAERIRCTTEVRRWAAEGKVTSARGFPFAQPWALGDDAAVPAHAWISGGRVSQHLPYSQKVSVFCARKKIDF